MTDDHEFEAELLSSLAVAMKRDGASPGAVAVGEALVPVVDAHGIFAAVDGMRAIAVSLAMTVSRNVDADTADTLFDYTVEALQLGVRRIAEYRMAQSQDRVMPDCAVTVLAVEGHA